MSQQQQQPSSNPTTAQTSVPQTTTNPNNTTTYQTGLETRRAVLGSAHVDRALSSTNAFTAPMQEMITEWAWANVWNRPGLDRKQRSLMNLGMLIALDRQAELGMHVRGAVRNGLSELEIREAVIHATVYCGAPAGMEGMRTVERMLGEMERDGEMVRALK